MSTYLERLRTEHMNKGDCTLDGTFADPLERHHENYSPERTIFLCHKCHFKVHFEPWLLTDEQKRRLLNCRYAGTREITQEMIDDYRPPTYKGKEPAI